MSLPQRVELHSPRSPDWSRQSFSQHDNHLNCTALFPLASHRLILYRIVSSQIISSCTDRIILSHYFQIISYWIVCDYFVSSQIISSPFIQNCIVSDCVVPNSLIGPAGCPRASMCIFKVLHSFSQNLDSSQFVSAEKQISHTPLPLGCHHRCTQ